MQATLTLAGTTQASGIEFESMYPMIAELTDSGQTDYVKTYLNIVTGSGQREECKFPRPSQENNGRESINLIRNPHGPRARMQVTESGVRMSE